MYYDTGENSGEPQSQYVRMNSEEGFSEEELNAYHDHLDGEEYDEFDFDDDGQPTEYEEWQDFYGGDDWDHGQYDHCF